MLHRREPSTTAQPRHEARKGGCATRGFRARPTCTQLVRSLLSLRVSVWGVHTCGPVSEHPDDVALVAAPTCRHGDERNSSERERESEALVGISVGEVKSGEDVE
eukprot:692291-Pyramimonas_sp.AAC.1